MEIIEIINNLFQYFNDFENKFFIIIIVIFCSTILFCLPIPAGITVFLIGMTFGIYGFLVSYISFLISAIVTFIFMDKVINKFFNNLSIYKKFLNYSINLKKNSYLLLMGRIIIPFPIFSYLATILKINFLQYMIATSLGVIPGTLAITMISSRLKHSIASDKIISFNIFQDPIFVIAIILLCTLIFLSKKIKEKYFTN